MNSHPMTKKNKKKSPQLINHVKMIWQMDLTSGQINMLKGLKEYKKLYINKIRKGGSDHLMIIKKHHYYLKRGIKKQREEKK